MRLLGLDPGLQRTGWGIVDAASGRLSHVANGTVSSEPGLPLGVRLTRLHDGLRAVIDEWRPNVAAVEETFVNRNPGSTLKLGQARGIAVLVPALAGMPVHEYAPNLVKKTVVGTGHATKDQIHLMVRTLLPGCRINGPDAADALAVAICHAHAAEGLEAILGAVANSNERHRPKPAFRHRVRG